LLINNQTRKKRQNNIIHTANRSNYAKHTHIKRTLELLIPLFLRFKTGQDQRAIKKIKRDIFRRLFLRRGPSPFSRFQIGAARAAVDGRRENEEEIEYKSKECEKGGYNEER